MFSGLKKMFGGDSKSTVEKAPAPVRVETSPASKKPDLFDVTMQAKSEHRRNILDTFTKRQRGGSDELLLDETNRPNDPDQRRAYDTGILWAMHSVVEDALRGAVEGDTTELLSLKEALGNAIAKKDSDVDLAAYRDQFNTALSNTKFTADRMVA